MWYLALKYKNETNLEVLHYSSNYILIAEFTFIGALILKAIFMDQRFEK